MRSLSWISALSLSLSLSIHTLDPILCTICDIHSIMNDTPDPSDTWEGEFDPLADPEERRVLFAALDSFRCEHHHRGDLEHTKERKRKQEKKRK